MAVRDDAPSSGWRILVVEDNSSSRVSLQRLLELRGHRVTAVADAVSAIAAFDAAEGFDLVLTDLMLPDKDGREVARRACRSEPRPIVALTTGNAFTGEAAGARAEGVDLIYFKPLSVDRILEDVRRLRGDAEG
jgi:two-component system cell cycle response regulator CpdR